MERENGKDVWVSGEGGWERCVGEWRGRRMGRMW